VLTNGPTLLNEYPARIQTNISYRDAKMAEDGVTRDIEVALNKFVNTTERNRNMRKEMKTIYETMSTLSNLTLKVQLEEGKSEETRK